MSDKATWLTYEFKVQILGATSATSGDTILNSTLTLDIESVNFRSWLELHVL